jgi:RNA-directed DNA polymerase
MREKIRELGVRQRTEVSMVDIAGKLNPLLRGWIQYYGRYTSSALKALYLYVEEAIAAWLRRKFKRLNARRGRAFDTLKGVRRQNPKLFVHWQIAASGKFT